MVTKDPFRAAGKAFERRGRKAVQVFQAKITEGNASAAMNWNAPKPPPRAQALGQPPKDVDRVVTVQVSSEDGSVTHKEVVVLKNSAERERVRAKLEAAAKARQARQRKK